MKNTFNISEKEKNRILNLHESYTDSFGTGNLNEQDYQISDMLGELTKLYTVTSEHIAFVDKAIECGYKPSSPKCKMESWAQDDECVRESLKAILEIPETLACIGKSVDQNVKDMIAKLAPQ